MEVSNLALCMSWTSNAKKSRVTQRSSEIAWDRNGLIQGSSGSSDIMAGRRCSVIELDVKGRDLCLFLSGFVTRDSQWRKMNEYWLETEREEGRELRLCQSVWLTALIWYCDTLTANQCRQCEVSATTRDSNSNISAWIVLARWTFLDIVINLRTEGEQIKN